MAGDISIVAIVKGEEKYVFMFDDDTRSETLRLLGRYASNPELSFSWYDAAVLSQKIRKTSKTHSSHELSGPHTNHSSPSRTSMSPLHDGFAEEDSWPDFDFPSADDGQWISDDPSGT